MAVAAIVPLTSVSDRLSTPIFDSFRSTGSSVSNLKHLVICLLLLFCTAVAADPTDYFVQIPESGVSARTLAVVVNDADPLSVRIANYYREARDLPEAHLIHVRFEAGRRTLPAAEFGPLRAAVLARLPAGTQALALTWALPFRVDCMSITSAFAFGFDRAYCSARTCAATRASPWYASDATAPFDAFGLLPTMSLAAVDFDQAKRLIDRGVRADGALPRGTAYLVSTSDRARNVRALQFPYIARRLAGWLDVRVEQTDTLADRDDVLFYFTGLPQVAGLASLRFLPGAVADHLTSAGGVLDGTRQMSALRWLEAGATGSYGTVVEPCNLLAKFPNPGVLIDAYSHGATLLEAYWKSVRQPGEGLFIGEPLAAPFAGVRFDVGDDRLIVHTRELRSGNYRLLVAPDRVGPYRALPGTIDVGDYQDRLELPRLEGHGYRLVRIGPVDAGRRRGGAATGAAR